VGGVLSFLTTRFSTAATHQLAITATHPGPGWILMSRRGTPTRGWPSALELSGLPGGCGKLRSHWRGWWAPTTTALHPADAVAAVARPPNWKQAAVYAAALACFYAAGRQRPAALALALPLALGNLAALRVAR